MLGGKYSYNKISIDKSSEKLAEIFNQQATLDKERKYK